jgi:hypothetical protein
MLGEYEILRLLNSAPLRNHPGNSTITVLQFIGILFCDGCDEVPFRS